MTCEHRWTGPTSMGVYQCQACGETSTSIGVKWEFKDMPSAFEFLPFKLVGGADGTETIGYTTKDGRMFWRGKEIKNEAEFRGLVLTFTDTPSAASDDGKKE